MPANAGRDADPGEGRPGDRAKGGRSTDQVNTNGGGHRATESGNGTRASAATAEQVPVSVDTGSEPS